MHLSVVKHLKRGEYSRTSEKVASSRERGKDHLFGRKKRKKIQTRLRKSQKERKEGKNPPLIGPRHLSRRINQIVKDGRLPLL